MAFISQVLEHLHSKYKALGSNPNTKERKRIKRRVSLV
jgi:hypothetical protein